MKDNYDDKITVGVEWGEVYLEVHDSMPKPGRHAIAALTPMKARKLAKKLLKAADEIEAKGD